MSEPCAGSAHFVFGNDQVELKIDSKTGFIRDIFSKETGLHHKGELSGIWPFGLRMGDGYAPDLLRVQVDASDACADQEMTYEIAPTPGGRTLRMTYDNMLTTGGYPSGIKLTVTISLADDADYFLITADVENHGKYNITNIFSGWGGLVAGSDRQAERLAVPEWNMGTIYHNPSEFFPDREVLGYPIYGSRGALTAGWLDLYSDEGGIGIGYINTQELMMYFNMQSRPRIATKLGPDPEEGLAFNWQLLNLLHDKSTELLATVGGVYPVRPGESFSTDAWILAPHAGDWHRMADIYRAEYEKAFAGDYLDWDHTHDEAKKIDLAVYRSIYVKEESPDAFRTSAAAVKEMIETTGVAPENLMVSLLVFWHKAPLYFPDHFPCGRANADEAIAEFKKAVSEIRAMGVQTVMLLTHLFYNHPKAVDYVPEAETDYDHANTSWNQIGNVACVEQTEWQDLWKDSYIPGYRSVDVSGLMLDQGPVAHLVCANPNHVHGTDAAKMLGSFSRGTNMQIKAIKEGFGDRGCFLWCECSGDIPTRNVDMWAASDGSGDGREEGTDRTMDVLRYTFPYRLCSYAAFLDDWTVRHVNECLIKAYVAGGYFGFSLDKDWPHELDEAISQYLRVRKELRDQSAPGYPQGYKDTVGLSVGDDHLVARVYAGHDGLTVVYYASQDVDTTIEVEMGLLRLPDRTERFAVSLKKDQADYRIIGS